ncbi:MAG: family 1 glycosylhydrolase [Ferroplasma sp.]
MLRKYPDNFLFGTAISAFQTEMGHSHESISPYSDWYEWVHNSEIIKKTYVSGDFPDDGPDFWDNYKSFIDKAAYMENNAIRLGIDWARIFKKSTEAVNVDVKRNEKGDIFNINFTGKSMEQLEMLADKEAIKHYADILMYAKSKNLKIILTIYHWPLPLWLHDPVAMNSSPESTEKSGWMNKKSVIEFGKYVYYIFNKLHEYVDIWHTINEANIIAINGYLYGNLEGFPPGLSDYSMAKTVLRNLAYAHNVAYKIIKNIDPGSTVGINIAAPFFYPEYNTPKNNFISNYVHYLFIEMFLDSALYGNFDNSFSGIADESRPYEFAGTDYIGVDYYNRISVRYVDNDNVDIRYRYAFLPCKNCSDNYWDIYPEGLRMVLIKLFNKYHKSLMVMENGVADADGKFRNNFIKNHLVELHKAIKEDFLPVTGYFYWSLMDNYEWAAGYKYKFGLYSYSNGQYEPTSSVELYKQVCHEHGIEDSASKP